jgi:peptidoglycan hydrolase CwlO-like protein
MADSNAFAAIAGVVSVTISAGVGWATHKSATRSVERNNSLTSRTDIEKEAFERAKSFYTDTIDRQDHDLDELREENRRLKQEVAGVHRENRELMNQLDDLKGRVMTCETNLRTAEKALRLIHRDDEE